MCFSTGLSPDVYAENFTAANISTGAAYNFFSSKADIVPAFVINERQDIVELISRMTSVKQPVQGISKLVNEAIKYRSRDQAVLAVQIYAEVSRDPKISLLAQENMLVMQDCFKASMSDSLELRLNLVSLVLDISL
ncbi:MAG: hypothetical protein OFPI_06390 [Osedax symbiont Rs2]|nr:MAG: hypothetical protein OFPI_06390 [Osedax symbiont Rs2]